MFPCRDNYWDHNQTLSFHAITAYIDTSLINTLFLQHCIDSCWNHFTLVEWHSYCICGIPFYILLKLFVSLVRSLCDVVTAVVETVQSTRNECRMCLMDSWWSRCYWEAQRERRMYGRWLDAAEYVEKRFAELSVVDEVDNDVVGRVEDGQSQLNQDEPTGRFGLLDWPVSFYRNKTYMYSIDISNVQS